MAVTLPTGPPGRALAIGLTLAVFGLIWFLAAAPLIDGYAAGAETLEQRRRVADRMQALSDTLPALRREAAGAVTAAGPQALFAGPSDAVAGAAMQGQLESLAAAAGVTLSSAELLPVEAAGPYRRMGLRLAGTGAWPALMRLLQAVDQASPRMLVDDVQLQSASSLTAGSVSPMTAALTVIAFRIGSTND